MLLYLLSDIPSLLVCMTVAARPRLGHIGHTSLHFYFVFVDADGKLIIEMCH